MSITPADIEAQTFPISFRGYQVEAVDAFLDRLHTELRHGDAEPAADPRISVPTRAAADASAATGPVPPQEPDHLPEDGGHTARALRTLVRAEQMAEQVLAEAAAEADQVRARAHVEAGNVLAAARAESSRFEAELHVRHEREVGALAQQAQQLRAEIDRLSHLEREYHDALQALLSEQQRVLEQRLPGLEARTAVAPSSNGFRPAG